MPLPLRWENWHNTFSAVSVAFCFLNAIWSYYSLLQHYIIFGLNDICSCLLWYFVIYIFKYCPWNFLRKQEIVGLKLVMQHLVDKDSSSEGLLMLSSECVSRFTELHTIFDVNELDIVFIVESLNIEDFVIFYDGVLFSSWDAVIELRDLYR